MKTARAAMLLSSLILSTSFAVQAQESTERTAGMQDQPAAGATDGVMVAIDPKTGKLRQPTAAEAQALQAKAAVMPMRSAAQSRGVPVQPRTAAEARATLRSHGRGKSMQVPESAMSHLTATRGADGQIHLSEGDAPQQIQQEVTK